MKPYGYFRDFSNVKKELESIIKDLGHFPTSTELRDNGYDSLRSGIAKYHGGIRQVREKFGEKNPRRPYGYWKEWNNVKKEFEAVIDELGHFPTQKEISDLGRSYLTGAANNFGGLIVVGQKLGYSPNTKISGYWKEWSNVENELEEIIKKLGHFPTQTELYEIDRSDLIHGMLKYHGGMMAIREKMGYEQIVKPKGYWMEWENVEKELKKLIKKNKGRFPTNKQIRESSLTLQNVVNTYHGGMIKVRERLGFKPGRVAHGYWDDINNVKSKLDEIIEETGEFPTQTELTKRGLGGLIHAITYEHGGVGNIRKLYGLEGRQKPSGYWTLERVLDTCRKLTQDNGRFPTQKELNVLNGDLKGLIGGINNHGGMTKIQQLLGIEDIAKRQNYWNKEVVLTEARKIVDELGYLPTQQQLDKMGHSKLVAAIAKYSSLTEVRKKLGLEQNKAPNGYWTEQKILKECRKLIKEQGNLPSQKTLRELGYQDLSSQIERNGGYYYFREKLGLKPLYKGHGFWKNRDNVLNVARELYNAHGRIPSEKELADLGYGTMPKVAQRLFGGLVNLRLIIEEEMKPKQKEQLEELLKSYAGDD